MRYCFCLLLSLTSLVPGAIAQSTLDLSQHDFERTIRLSGSWDFYWNQLLSPEDFKSQPKAEQLTVPGSWHRMNKKYEMKGYATYRVQLVLPANHHNLALYIPVINSSSKIWINGILVEQVGVVSSDPVTYRAGLTSSVINLPDTQHVDLIIQVANFSYFMAGIISTPTVGTPSLLFRSLNQQRGVENFFAGSLMAMFIYQIILFLFYQKGKPYLFLALICLAVALRALVRHGGSLLLPDLFPGVDWEYWKKLEFFSVYVIVALFPCYLFFLFRSVASLFSLRVFIALATFLCLAVLVTPQYVYGRLLNISHIGILGGFIYAGVVIYKAGRKREPDAKIILLGILCSFPFILLEIMRNSLLVTFYLPFNYLVESGVLVFLLFQVFLLSRHHSQSYKNLEMLNLSLEQKVSDRTTQLTTANRIKDKLLSVISHDIKSPLNTLRGTLTIFTMGAVDEKEMKRLLVIVDERLDQTATFVENILLWTKSQLKGVKIIKQSLSIHALAEEHVLLFREAAEKKGIRIENDTDHFLNVWADKNVVSLVLRNLISNAIKFSGSGKISLSTSFDKGIVSLYVKDNGVGIPEEKLKKIFEGDAESTYGTNKEKGTGLGLVLCLEYLKAMDSSLYAKSEEGKGTTFWMTLPLSV